MAEKDPNCAYFEFMQDMEHLGKRALYYATLFALELQEIKMTHSVNYESIGKMLAGYEAFVSSLDADTPARNALKQFLKNNGENLDDQSTSDPIASKVATDKVLQ